MIGPLVVWLGKQPAWSGCALPISTHSEELGR
jgi:hypothetical protein